MMTLKPLSLFCLIFVPFRSAIGSIDLIIDIESQATNNVYTFLGKKRTLREIEADLLHLVKVAPAQAKELTVERFNKRADPDPFAVFRDFESGETNKQPESLKSRPFR